MAAQDNTTIESFINNEIKAVEKAKKKSLVSGIFIMVFIAGYWIFFLQFASNNLNPKTISDVITTVAVDNIPPFTRTVKASVESALPETVFQLRTQALGEIKNVKKGTLSLIKNGMGELFSGIDDVFKEEFWHEVSPHRAEIEAHLQQVDDPHKAAEAVKALAILLNQTLHTEMKGLIQETAKELRDIEAKIFQYKSAELSPENELEKRFLKYWIQFLNVQVDP